MTILSPRVRPVAQPWLFAHGSAGFARIASMAALLLLLATSLAACRDEAAEARKRVAGDYVMEVDGGQAQWHVKEMLTLHANGSWRRTLQITAQGMEQPSPPDSGTYRIRGVTLGLLSLVQRGALMQYTISGDTLYGADASRVYAMTGSDIGEKVLVRVH